MPDVSLLSKLHTVATKLHYIEKTGRNEHHNYNYAKSVDVVRSVREILLENNLLLVPANPGIHWENVEMKNGSLLTFITLRYRVYDIDSGENIEFEWAGAGADKGGDKGLYKAYTGGLKYALLTLFLIPTSDDPEGDQLSDVEERDPAPRIPPDRARAILESAIAVKLVESTDEGFSFHPAFQACLASENVTKIGELSVDGAEAVEEFLRSQQ